MFVIECIIWSSINVWIQKKFSKRKKEEKEEEFFINLMKNTNGNGKVIVTKI